jgi:hypothetical protein
MPVSRYRVLAALLFLGAAFLLYRTLAMLAGGAAHDLVPWVVALLFLELVLDALTMGMCLLWGITLSIWHGIQVFRLTAAVVIVHAVRVLIFVLGRTGPWVDFDVQSLARAGHAARWSWFGVWFAGTLSVISLVLLFAVWLYLRRRNRQGRIPRTKQEKAPHRAGLDPAVIGGSRFRRP